MEKENSKPLFEIDSPFMLSIDGSAAKALKIACDEFVKDGKDLRDFSVTIRLGRDETDDNTHPVFIVT